MHAHTHKRLRIPQHWCDNLVGITSLTTNLMAKSVEKSPHHIHSYRAHIDIYAYYMQYACGIYKFLFQPTYVEQQKKAHHRAQRACVCVDVGAVCMVAQDTLLVDH